MPRWMQYILSDETAPAFYRFGTACMNIAEGMAVKALRGKEVVHGLKDLTLEDVENIFKMCM